MYSSKNKELALKYKFHRYVFFSVLTLLYKFILISIFFYFIFVGGWQKFLQFKLLIDTDLACYLNSYTVVTVVIHFGQYTSREEIR